MQLNTTSFGNNVTSSQPWKWYLLKRSSSFLPQAKAEECVWCGMGEVGSLTFPFLRCALWPASGPSPQGMEGEGVGNKVVSWDNSEWVHLLVLRSKRSASDDDIGCSNAYIYRERSSLDVSLYSVERLGLLRLMLYDLRNKNYRKLFSRLYL